MIRRTGKVKMISVSVGLGMMFMGCATSVPVTPQPALQPTPAVATPIAKAGQSLPISAKVKVGDQVVQLEVAKTPEQQAMGLMFRAQIPPDRGMLFPFNPPRPVSFWMKNVLVDLDMVFLRNGKVVAIASNVPPCKTDPCPVYGPQEAVDHVLELGGGRAKALGIKPGDRLLIESIP